MKKKSTPKSYTEAYREIQSILIRLESDEVNVDALTEDIKRANILVDYCQEKLRAIGEELSENK